MARLITASRGDECVRNSEKLFCWSMETVEDAVNANRCSSTSRTTMQSLSGFALTITVCKTVGNVRNFTSSLWLFAADDGQ